MEAHGRLPPGHCQTRHCGPAPSGGLGEKRETSSLPRALRCEQTTTQRPAVRPGAPASNWVTHLSALGPPETVVPLGPPTHRLLVFAALFFLPSPGGLGSAGWGPAVRGEWQGSRRPLSPTRPQDFDPRSISLGKHMWFTATRWMGASPEATSAPTCLQ
ncbi:hypothetical protein NDU88_007469 [Pleurodeles waltl]|uniref:Uncharacterized protein n=1 Tax=Pleurodeles waltl TaxID=8319 RepID=A0AAV7QL13_PLEWA|nr:hypothetical protein NDU88_007469 [Pleurodeles waltl]